MGSYLHIECKFADDRSKRPSECEKPKELEIAIIKFLYFLRMVSFYSDNITLVNILSKNN